MLVSMKIAAKSMDVSTRRKRKTALLTVICMIEKIIEAEETYLDNMPANLQGGETCFLTTQHIKTIYRALDFLHQAYL